MKNILRKILLVGLLFGYISADDDWKFVCEPSELSGFSDKRYFPVSSNENFYLTIADSKTIQIDKKNKTIKVWTIWLSSQNGRDNKIKSLGKYDNYDNFGYSKMMDIIDYRTMRTKLISFMNINCDGSLIRTVDVNSGWEQIAPDTTNEGIVESIMKKYNLK